MSGVTEKKEEQGEQMEMSEEEEEKVSRKKRRKVVVDEDRIMDFGPHRRNAYGEVLGRNQRYAMYLILEGKRGNQKARFAHCVMAFAVSTFF